MDIPLSLSTLPSEVLYDLAPKVRHSKYKTFCAAYVENKNKRKRKAVKATKIAGRFNR